MVASVWKVLSVDDDPEFHRQLERILSSRMGENTFDFTCETSFSQGVELLRNNRFDLVFLDVHEANTDPDPSDNPEQEDQRGEQLLDDLKSSRFVPVIFYTGYPAKVGHLKSHVVKVVDKGATTEDVRSAVSAVLSTGLPQLTQYIEEKSRAYIWDNLESVLKTVTDDNVTSDIALLAARNLAKNLSQRSIKELLGSDINLIAPLEMYLFPPEQGACNPADIFKRKDDGTLWMVLTPACDFEQRNAENVLLARVFSLEEHELYQNWKAEAQRYNGMPADQRGKKSLERLNGARKKVKELVNNVLKARYRFLPGTFFLPDCVVDFQNLVHMPIADSTTYEAICSLDNPYREEFLQFFSNYYGRIGTPDYEKNAVWEKIDQSFSPD